MQGIVTKVLGKYLVFGYLDPLGQYTQAQGPYLKPLPNQEETAEGTSSGPFCKQLGSWLTLRLAFIPLGRYFVFWHVDPLEEA